MKLKLDGKRALVTGASAGIGSAIACWRGKAHESWCTAGTLRAFVMLWIGLLRLAAKRLPLRGTWRQTTARQKSIPKQKWRLAGLIF